MVEKSIDEILKDRTTRLECSEFEKNMRREQIRLIGDMSMNIKKIGNRERIKCDIDGRNGNEC
jgi:hypothetical protein